MNNATAIRESLNSQGESGTVYVAVTGGVNYSPDKAFRGFIVGVSGNVNIVGLDGMTCVLPAMVAGVCHPCAGQGILAASTTATGIVAVF